MPKRLVLAIDGTWVSSDNGYSPSIWGPSGVGTLASPSNVTRLCRALKSRATGDVEQIVYYQGGLGSQANFYSFVIGGYLGDGIDAAIREAYGFLANNYEDGELIELKDRPNCTHIRLGRSLFPEDTIDYTNDRHFGRS